MEGSNTVFSGQVGLTIGCRKPKPSSERAHFPTPHRTPPSPSLYSSFFPTFSHQLLLSPRQTLTFTYVPSTLFLTRHLFLPLFLFLPQHNTTLFFSLSPSFFISNSQPWTPRTNLNSQGPLFLSYYSEMTMMQQHLHCLSLTTTALTINTTSPLRLFSPFTSHPRCYASEPNPTFPSPLRNLSSLPVTPLLLHPPTTPTPPSLPYPSPLYVTLSLSLCFLATIFFFSFFILSFAQEFAEKAEWVGTRTSGQGGCRRPETN